MNNKGKGGFGETFACNYLVKRGFKIIYKNWTCRWGELDVIAKDSDTLVFIEVKYRTSQRFGKSYEAINFKKKQSLMRSINYFLLSDNFSGVSWRVDAVCLDKIKGKISVNYYKSIFG